MAKVIGTESKEYSYLWGNRRGKYLLMDGKDIMWCTDIFGIPCDENGNPNGEVSKEKVSVTYGWTCFSKLEKPYIKFGIK